jgi:tetrahydromethanopterin S-methyltransferase subunit G
MADEMTLQDIAILMKTSFDEVDDRFDDLERRLTHFGAETVANGDALTRISRKMDMEFAAIHSHLSRLDERVDFTP